MVQSYEVKNTDLSDLEKIYDLFDHSIIYQEKNGFPVWKNYDKHAIINDIANRNQYKILVDEQIAIVFSIGYTDRVIWRTWDTGNSIYLHRIVVNPQCKGQKLFGLIMEWAIKHAVEKGLSNIRLDTWAANPTIINYYRNFGFAIIENYTTPDSTELPLHNRNLTLTLLEYKLQTNSFE